MVACETEVAPAELAPVELDSSAMAMSAAVASTFASGKYFEYRAAATNHEARLVSELTKK